MISLLIPILIATKTFTLKENDTLYSIKVEYINKLPYFKLKDIQPVIKFNIIEDIITKRWVVKLKEKKVTLIPGTYWIKSGDKYLNIPISCDVRKNEFLIPLPVLDKLYEYFLNKNIRIDKNTLVPYRIGRKIDKIVIDAGHGGKDPGAIGPSGLMEKNVVIEVAKLVAKLLAEDVEITCVLTRDTDVFLPLGRRAEIANNKRASLFLSVHCNAGRRRAASGTEVYFLSPAQTSWERAVEARENASLEYEVEEEMGELESILWDLAQTEFLKESNTLAGKLEKSISNTANTERRGVKQANFYVLRKVYMPACLIELDFISNPAIEKRMKDKDFLLDFAKGIVEGISEFKKWYEEKTL